MKDLFKKLNLEELYDFLDKYAKKDTKFANAVNVRFRHPEFKQELKKITRDIDIALDGVSDYRNHDSWGYVSFDTSDILAEINQRTSQGHIRLAFAEVEFLYRKLLENFEYQGECEICDEAEYCLTIMSEIASCAITTEDKQYIFEHCIELSELEDGKDYGANYEDKLLLIAVKFATLENRSELEHVLAILDSKWREEDFKLIVLELVRKFDGEKALNDFIYDNLHFPKLREIAFDNAISRKDFAEGERLCIDALSIYNQYHCISPWLYKLYNVYEMISNTKKMTETAREILLAGDLEFYNKSKVLLKEQGAWDSTYASLLIECAEKLHYQKYMDILVKENEHALLLEQLKKHKYQVYNYGKSLSSNYPDDIRDIYIEQINKETESANKRERYREVCHHISFFANAGYKQESAILINELKSTYKRKPAFVDELNKV